MVKYFSIIAALVLMFAASCTRNDEPANPGNDFKEIPLTAYMTRSVSQANSFAFDFLKAEICRKACNENVVLSPYSMFVTMSMMANGDDGETAQRLKSILGFNDADIEYANEYNKTLMAYLPEVDALTECRIANSLWYSPDLKLRSEFGDVMARYYESSLKAESPDGENGMEFINSWVSKNTLGKIPALLKIPLMCQATVVNASYFRSQWEKKFDKKNTKKGVFKNLNGNDADAYFMNMDGSMDYSESDGFKMISLFFGNKNYAMDFILPDGNGDFKKSVLKLNAEVMESLYEKSSEHVVNLSLPKFKVTSNDDIVESLMNMGLKSITLSKIIENEQLKLNSILHAVSVEIDETGAEAAAATLTNIVVSPSPADHINLSFDRPFAYLIRETSTGTILFAGVQANF